MPDHLINIQHIFREIHKESRKFRSGDASNELRGFQGLNSKAQTKHGDSSNFDDKRVKSLFVKGGRIEPSAY